MIDAKAPSSPMAAFAFNKDSEAPAALDLRSCAIDVCGLWETQKNGLKRLKTAQGMLRRGDVVQAARAMEALLDEAHSRQGNAEHPDSRAARKAVVDWIVHQVQGVPKRTTFERLASYGRFFWGYLERTPLYHAYFECRKAVLEQVPGRLFVDLVGLQTGICSMGFAYGAPTLGALADGRKEKGRGHFARIGLNDGVWSVIEKNKEAHAFVRAALALEQKLATIDSSAMPPPILIEEEAAETMKAMVEPVIRGFNGGPQFIVSRGGQRMRLHLKIARHGSGAKTCGDDPHVWRKNRHGLFHAIEDVVFLRFKPFADKSGDTLDWGTFEQLHWHLDPVNPSHRQHRRMFKKAWSVA